MPRADTRQKQLPDGKCQINSHTKQITYMTAGFVELLSADGSDTRGSIIQCTPCSQRSGVPLYVRRSGLAAHQKANRHKQAVLWYQERIRNNAEATHRSTISSAATSVTLPHIQVSAAQSVAPQLEAQSASCLNDLELNEQGLLTDQTGMPIMFNAGHDSAYETDANLRAELNNFRLFGHLNPSGSAFASTGREFEEMYDIEEDASLPYMSAEMAAMGQSHTIHHILIQT